MRWSRCVSPVGPPVMVVSGGGGVVASTTTVPVISGWMPQTNEYVPAASNWQ